MDMAVEVMGTMQTLDPTDALLLAVWRSASIAAGYARALQEMPSGEPRDALLRDLRAANREQAQIAHMAVQGRVAERQVDQMNRFATAFARVAEAALVVTLAELGVEETRGPQTVFAAALGRELARLEDGLGDVEGTASER